MFFQPFKLHRNLLYAELFLFRAWLSVAGNIALKRPSSPTGVVGGRNGVAYRGLDWFRCFIICVEIAVVDFLGFPLDGVGILIITIAISIYTAVRRPAWFNSYIKMWGGKGYEDPFYPFRRWTADPASVPWRHYRLQFAAVMVMFFGFGLAFFLMEPGTKPWRGIAVFWIFAAYFLWLVVRITRFGNGR